LAMVLCGLALGLMLHLGSLWRRPVLRCLWQVLTALMVGSMALFAFAKGAGGLRAYGLLGLVVGAALYAAGLARPMAWLFARLAKSPLQKEGKSDSRDECT